MKTTIVKLEAPELQTIEKSKAEKIEATFEPMAKMLLEFEKAFLKITSEAEKEITKDVIIKAKRLRIDIGKIRIETERARKSEKEEYLRAGKAIDGVSNILKWAVVDKENKLKEIEDYFETQERIRLEELQKERAGKLSKYVEDADERNLSGMDEDVCQAFFAIKKKEYDDQMAAEKQAEIDRIAKEKAEAEERKRIRIENEQLKKEAEEKEKQRQREIAKAEAERKAKKEEQERIEAELKAKKEAERKAKAAPDKAKLIELAKSIDYLSLPEVKSEEAQRILINTKELLNKVSNFIREKTQNF